jgi:hypothetical protein
VANASDSRRGRVEGEPHRVTFGSALERDPVPLRAASYSSSHYTLTAFEILPDAHGPRAGMRPAFSSLADPHVMARLSRDGSEGSRFSIAPARSISG